MAHAPHEAQQANLSTEESINVEYDTRDKCQVPRKHIYVCCYISIKKSISIYSHFVTTGACIK